jgi:hypothetical protein
MHLAYNKKSAIVALFLCTGCTVCHDHMDVKE